MLGILVGSGKIRGARTKGSAICMGSEIPMYMCTLYRSAATAQQCRPRFGAWRGSGRLVACCRRPVLRSPDDSVVAC